MPPDPKTAEMHLQRLQTALHRFQASGKPFQLIETLGAAATAPRPTRSTLVILDSSFNPPTIAHMAMATSALQELRTQRDIAATLKGGVVDEGKHTQQDTGARLLLLLAVNNADKAPKPASFEHRLLMMRYFAEDIQREEKEVPVDIGLTTQPYFHDKSASIARAPEYRDEAAATEQLFLAGYDTLIRIFNPKYYTPPIPESAGVAPSQDVEGKTPMQTSLDAFFARARLRVTMRTDAEWGGQEEQRAYLEGLVGGDALEEVGGRREWARRVELVEGLRGEEVLSSTEARSAVAKGDWERVKRLVPESVAGLVERMAFW